MITTQSIRYFILAGLIVTLPTHPMGWFNSTWKKVAVGIAAIAAVTAIIYGINRYVLYKKYVSREEHERRDAAVASELVARELQEAENKRQQEIRDREMAQRLAEKYDHEFKEDQQKRKDAEEKKQKAEHPIKSFAPTMFYQVHPQTGAACGLFALDNGNKAYQSLTANESLETLRKRLLEPLSPAANSIKARDMLTELDIKGIAREQLKMNAACYTVLPNISQGKDEFRKPLPCKINGFYFPETLGTAVQALRTQARATQIFIIANGRIVPNASVPAKFESHDNHWIAIVADKKDGIITFHYMDTGNGKDADIINALQEIIEHGHYYGMQLAAALEECNLDTITCAVARGNYRIVLNVFAECINLARKTQLVNDERFPKRPIQHNLEIIASSRQEPYKTQARELLNQLR